MSSSSPRLRWASVAAAALLLVALAAAPVDAASSGALTMCDLTPLKSEVRMWNGGCVGKNPWGLTCLDNNVMPWTKWPQASSVYTLRSSDVGTNISMDPQTYIPGGTLNELHLRTLQLDMRVIGLLMYATNGTDPVTLKERRVGSWTVLPNSNGGFQVPATCGYTAVTHNGADVKPMHARFWFAAPVGTGPVRFRVLIKEGVQGTGSFWWPSKELTLRQGAAPEPAPSQGANVSIATGAEQQVATLGALGQTCADACSQQRPATPFCHRKATVAISTPAAFTAANLALDKITCSMPLIAGCPYTGAARITKTADRVNCVYRSQDAATTCPSWISAAASGSNQSPAVDLATLFASGITSSADRSSPYYVPDVCYTEPMADSQNVCVCTNNAEAQGSNPFTLAAIVEAGKPRRRVAKSLISENVSAAPSRVSSAASALLLALLSATIGAASSRVSGSKLSLLVLAVLALLALASSPVSAHNYLRGLHRAAEAAVVKPCQAKLGNDPHVQIVADQIFEMEFTNGHGVNQGAIKTYFAILHASAFEQLRATNITSILKDYIDKAPADKLRFNKPDAAMWERQHRTSTSQWGGEPKYWKEPAGMSPTDPTFIAVDPIYDEKSHPGPLSGKKVITTQLHANYKSMDGGDRRAVYKSDKYPWLESVDEFMNPYNRDGSAGDNDFFSHQGDIARFNFSARSGPGDYIAWYSWGGYVDCVDINVLPGSDPVKYRYGRNATELGAKQYAIKLDHCEIRHVESATTPVRVLDPVTRDASKCVSECIDKGFNKCAAVQVVRVANLPSTVPYTPNIPWVPSVWNQSGWDDIRNGRQWPCRCFSPHECLQRGCKRYTMEELKKFKLDRWQEPYANANRSAFPDLRDEDYVCYGTKPWRNQDAQVVEDYYVADDPSDPAFYSTCYLTLTKGGFVGVPETPPSAPLEWLTNERCVACDFYAEASAYRLGQAPFWDRGLMPAAGMCADCSLHVSAAPAGADNRTAQFSALVGRDVPFSGYYAQKEQQEAATAAANAPILPADSGNGEENGAAVESSSSESGLFGLARVPGILVLVAIGVGGLLLLAIAVLALRSCRSARRSSRTDLNRMQCELAAGEGLGSTGLQANPAFQRL